MRVKVKGQLGSQGGALRGSRTSPGLQNSASPGMVPPTTCISSLGQLIKTQTPAPRAQAGTVWWQDGHQVLTIIQGLLWYLRPESHCLKRLGGGRNGEMERENVGAGGEGRQCGRWGPRGLNYQSRSMGMEDYVQCRSPFLHVAPKSSILNSCRKMAGGAYSTGLKTNKQTSPSGKPVWLAIRRWDLVPASFLSAPSNICMSEDV